MTQFFDDIGAFQGSFSQDVQGHGTFRNAMGLVTNTVFEEGNRTVIRDGLGTVVGSIQDVGGSQLFMDSIGRVAGRQTIDQLGRTNFFDAMGRSTGMFDPVSGNFSNAIGALNGFIR